MDRRYDTEPARELAHYFAYGTVGLMFEWFAMNLAPWSNPSANPLLMLVFQLGMWSFWTTVALAPRLFLVPDDLHRRTKRSILRFYIPYFAVVYLLTFAMRKASQEDRFLTTIFLVILAHLVVNVYFAVYFVRAFRRVWLASLSE